jgi:hypothetical protein
MADAVGALATLESSAVFGSGVCPSPSPSGGCTEGFDMLDDSGSEVATPDMESQVLFVKLKEVRVRFQVFKSISTFTLKDETRSASLRCGSRDRNSSGYACPS